MSAHTTASPGERARPAGPENAVTAARLGTITGAVFVLAAIFTLSTGLIVFMGDSYLLADRAKHLVQTGTLDLNNSLGALIYPPLYPIAISPAYLSASPQVSFQIILLIHALLVASQVLPFYKLLVGYSGVPARAALWLAALFSLAPSTLPYASMMLTEVLYFPLVLWMAYFYVQAQELGRKRDAFTTGALLGLMLLNRSAASTVVVAFGLAAAVHLWRARANWPALKNKLASVALCLIGLTLVYGAWKAYESAFVHYQAYAPYFTLDDIRKIFTDRSNFDHHFAWLANTVFYYIGAPLSIAGCFVYILLFRRFRIMARDPLAPLALLTLAVSAVTVVLVMDKGWGGRELTWNKYLAPYVFLLLLIAIRYRRLSSLAYLNTCAIVLSLAFFALRPSGLGCHFTDALVLFTSNSNPLHLPEAVVNALFVLAIYVPAWLWLGRSAWRKRLAAALTIALWLASDSAALVYYRRSGDFNISQYGGAAKQGLDFVSRNPGAAAYYDPEFASTDPFGALRVLFYWPRLMKPLPPGQLTAAEVQPGTKFAYFTNKKLNGSTAVVEDRGAVRLYTIAAQQLRPTPAPALVAGQRGDSSLRVVLSPHIWAVETSAWGGNEYKVRWLQQTSDFEIHNPGAPADATISMRLGTFGKPHTARLEVNGATAPDVHRITKVFWAQGPQRVSFRVRLKSGVNSCRLSSDSPDALPGGRLVCFLLIEEIAATLAGQ